MPHYFRAVIWKSHRYGQLLGTAGELGGVAAAIGPGGAAPEDEAEVRASNNPGGEAVGERFDHCHATFDRVFDPAEHALRLAVPEPHWYLEMLAVEPSQQGRGIGGALLRALNHHAETSGRPVALLTFQADSLPFYTRYGYEILCEEIDRVSGLHWLGASPTVFSLLTTIGK